MFASLPKFIHVPPVDLCKLFDCLPDPVGSQLSGVSQGFFSRVWQPLQADSLILFAVVLTLVLIAIVLGLSRLYRNSADAAVYDDAGPRDSMINEFF